MGTITETLPHAGGFLIEEGNGDISREAIVLAAGSGALRTAQVLGQILLAGATVAARPGNTGNGVFGAVTLAAGVMAGVYIVTIIEPAANAGAFTVEDPTGVTVGHGTVGVAFADGGLAFTLADGATDFIAGDQFAITVAQGSKKYVPLDPDGEDGRQHAAGILYRSVDATGADADATAIVRLATVNASDLVWPDGITAPEQAAALADLAARNIIAR